ncbi:WD repeat-containing protein 34 [Gonapodya sp. JEL0774]|nr:WD repeat-containing protein 34 [Gonapodya sp. JEL0774]
MFTNAGGLVASFESLPPPPCPKQDTGTLTDSIRTAGGPSQLILMVEILIDQWAFALLARESDVSTPAKDSLVSVATLRARGGCAAMAWNSTNTLLAIALAKMASPVLRHTVKAEACLPTLSWHPDIPSVVAAGTVTGCVLLWDLNQDPADGLVKGISGQPKSPGGLLHTDPITQVKWVLVRGDYQILSLSVDGLLFLWRLEGANLVPQSSGVMLLNSIPKLLRHKPESRSTTVSDVTRLKRTVLGGACLEQVNSGNVIVGTELGYVVSIDAERLAKAAGSNEKSQLPDVVTFAYKAHLGAITAIGRRSQSQFYTCGTDLKVHVYEERQPLPQKVISLEPGSVNLHWFPSGDLWFVREDGTLSMHRNLKEAETVTSGLLSGTTVTTVAGVVNTFAIGTDKGEIKVYTKRSGYAN